MADKILLHVTRALKGEENPGLRTFEAHGAQLTAGASTKNWKRLEIKITANSKLINWLLLRHPSRKIWKVPAGQGKTGLGAVPAPISFFRGRNFRMAKNHKISMPGEARRAWVPRMRDGGIFVATKQRGRSFP